MTDVLARRQGLSSASRWPVRVPHSPREEPVWLTTGQFFLLMYCRRRIASGHRRFTLVDAARATTLDVSNVSRGLDLLAKFGLVGRRSRRGRNGSTFVWSLRQAAARTGRTYRLAWPTRKVATSTSFAGFITREGWINAIERGERSAVRRLSPPRVLYDRCPAGHRVRLLRQTVPTLGPDHRTLAGSYGGWCRRCGSGFVRGVVAVLPLPAHTRQNRGDRTRQRSADYAAGVIDGPTFHSLEAADPWPGWEPVDGRAFPAGSSGGAPWSERSSHSSPAPRSASSPPPGPSTGPARSSPGTVDPDP